MILPVEPIAVACGVVTFLLRLLPMWILNPDNDANEAPSTATPVLNAIGPAAIAALLVVSLWPGANTTWNIHPWLAIASGLLTVILTKKLLGGIALPTLLGSIAYGALLQMGV